MAGRLEDISHMVVESRYILVYMGAGWYNTWHNWDISHAGDLLTRDAGAGYVLGCLLNPSQRFLPFGILPPLHLICFCFIKHLLNRLEISGSLYFCKEPRSLEVLSNQVEVKDI